MKLPPVHEMEIDGEQFVLFNEGEAEALLAQAQELAQQQAPTVAKSALNRARSTSHCSLVIGPNSPLRHPGTSAGPLGPAGTGCSRHHENT